MNKFFLLFVLVSSPFYAFTDQKKFDILAVDPFGKPELNQPSNTNDSCTAEVDCIDADYSCNRPILEAKFSYFSFSSHLLRKVYGNGGINYAVSATIPVWRGVSIWTAVDYFSKEGHALSTHEKTRIRILPLTLGLKYIYNFDAFGVYGGVGGRYFFLEQKNHSDFVDRKISRSGLGGAVEAGIMYYLCNHIVFDAFGGYSYKQLKAHTSITNVQTHSLNIGGWNVGGGVGFKF